MDIQDLIPKILDRIQTSGQQRPAIYAETSQGIESYQIFQFGDNDVKEDLLFFAGRTAGQKHMEHELLEVVFVAEIWRAHRDALKPDERPTDFPGRMEGVVFLAAKGTPPFAQVERMYDIQRDANGKVTGLVYAYETRNVESMQCLAFVAGWRSRVMSDEEVKLVQLQGVQLFLQ